MKKLACLLLLALLALLPAVLGEYYVNLGSQILIAVIFATSLNLLVGYAGLTSLGHAAYLGLSAYIAGWLALHIGLGHAMAAPLTLLATTAIGGVFGWIALRASGLSFLMLTLALSQVVWGVAYRWTAVTNGDNGLSGLTRPMPLGIDMENSNAYYWFVLLITALVLVVVARLVDSPFGASLRGTRDQARRMSSLGYNVWAIRWCAFVGASFLGAVAGLLYVYFHKYVHPSVLSVTASAEVLLSVIAGGAGTLAGPAIGALLVVLLKNYASGYVERWNMLLGAVFVFIVLVMPHGIVPGVRALFARAKGDRA
ncbi:ABC transporter permease [Variovorax paradoxus]|uniref:ABC transporter permease n=1 Tax=Variovorax paradoxus TaxID=34073 RepID=A0AA91DJA0_VARPD|nr:branched-chain amino acid ABC transporter permease [Variovorax paradoxus]OAK57964.1 ABC transporter permease [Variovorax paradoxus]